MTIFQAKIPQIVAAVIVCIIQLVIAPYITIGYAMCNFILCYVIALAITRASDVGYVIPFVLGMLYDLASSGPVGAMAFICVLMTFVISKLFTTFNNDSLFIPIALVVGGIVISEFIYAVLMITCGLDVGLLDALIYRVLPCSLYDTVVALIMLPIAMLVFGRNMRSDDLPLIG